LDLAARLPDLPHAGRGQIAGTTIKIANASQPSEGWSYTG